MVKGIKQGIGIALGFCVSAVFAYTVSGTIKTWTSGDTLTAADLNQTVQSIKNAVESAGQYVEITGTYVLTTPTLQWGRLLATVQTSVETPTTMPRAGIVKNAILKPSTSTVNAACTVTLRKNGANTLIQFAVPSGSTTQVTDSDTVTYSAGDTLGWYSDCPGGSTGQLGMLLSFEF